MPEGRKIATCSYCGTRAVLVFDRVRHELICTACGAPLHDMKFMPKATEERRKKSSYPAGSHSRLPTYPREASRDRQPAWQRGWQAEARKPHKNRKRRKPLMRRMLEELWDEVEDIFD